MTSQLVVRCGLYPHLSCSIGFLEVADDAVGDETLLKTTVKELKSRIAATLQVNPTAFPFTLAYNYAFLVDDSKTLKELGLRDGSIVDLVPSDVLAMLFPTESKAHQPSSSSGSGIRKNSSMTGVAPFMTKVAHAKDSNDIVPFRTSVYIPPVHEHMNHSASTISWPQIIVLAVVPNLMIAGSIFCAIQFMKEFKTFEQLSQEGGDAMAQGFLDTLAKDDYKICKEIVKKMLIGWMDEVNQWRRGWSSPYQLPLLALEGVRGGGSSSGSGVSNVVTSSAEAIGNTVSNWAGDYSQLIDSFKPPSSGK